MQTLTRSIPLFTLCLLLAACAKPPEEKPSLQPAEISSPVMECGRLRIDVQPEGNTLTLHADGKRYDLQQVPSASGARYELPDDSGTFFWSKNDQAQLQLSGQAWPVCSVPGAVVEPFRVRGNEPFWAIELDDGWLTLQRPGEAVLKTRYRVTRSDDTQQIIRAAMGDVTLELALSDKLCHDTMSGMPFPQSAHLEWSGQVLSGCAGEPEQLLLGADWAVQSMQGQPVTADAQPTLHFTVDQKILGHGSCNRYGGNYRLSGEALEFGSLYSTKMACASPIMDQEQQFFALMEQVRLFDIAEDGSLILLGADGEILRAYLK